jgi:hypothetical protein
VHTADDVNETLNATQDAFAAIRAGG